MCAEAHVGHSAAAMRSGAGRRSCVRGRGGVAAARGVRGMREGQRVDSPFLWLQRVDRGVGHKTLPRRGRAEAESFVIAISAARAYKKDFLRRKRRKKKQKCSL